MDTAEVIRLMRDPDLAGEVVGLVTALVHAQSTEVRADTRPAIDYADVLSQTPERACASMMHLASFLAALVVDTAEAAGSEPAVYLERWALMYQDQA